MTGFPDIAVDNSLNAPLYKQIAERLAAFIENGRLERGQKLPATRELAGHLGMNRATISSAYSLLEKRGLIQGHVGRGSFVADVPGPAIPSATPPHAISSINFASSRPAREAFPLASFRKLAKTVIDSDEAGDFLQLGSSYGYGPLRRYLLERAKSEGVARPGDDLIVTNGCQQALDLVARTVGSGGASVVCEDPVYHGLLRVFARSGSHVFPAPVGPEGLDLEALADILSHQKVRLIVVTPSFQNPTGATIPAHGRQRLVELAQRAGATLVESDVYSELRYRGEPLQTLKQMDPVGNTVLLRSYSKISFPGLRVGWALGPRDVIARMAEEKQIADLHSDQLSQAVLLSFAQSGELDLHVARTRQTGRERLDAVLEACATYLPPGSSWTKPEGGMSLWVDLPAPLTSEALLSKVRALSVDFLPGRHFSPGAAHIRGLRISFGGLSPESIRRGMEILGDAAREELAASRNSLEFEPAVALV